MNDNRTLKHYNVPKGGVVHLNPDKMGMYIRKPDGNTVLVKPTSRSPAPSPSSSPSTLTFHPLTLSPSHPLTLSP